MATLGMHTDPPLLFVLASWPFSRRRIISPVRPSPYDGNGESKRHKGTGMQRGTLGGEKGWPEVSPEDLMRYLDGELPPEEWERVDNHVTRCRSLQGELYFCQMLASDLRAFLLSFEIPHDSIWGTVSAKLPRPSRR
jgi:hypothetical protein